MTTEKNWIIHDIEALTEKQASEMAESVQTIKGHHVYFVDFGGYFGYSVLVFADGEYLKYANDYELHHGGRTREELHSFYVEKLNNTLFTEEELSGPVSNYDEFRAKEYYIHNHYGMRRPGISQFFIGSDAEREAMLRKIKNMVYSPVFYAYYDQKYADFVKRGSELLESLYNARNANAENFDYWKNAFLYEMYNHEYGINWEGDYDVCACFGGARGFNEVQRRAYAAARREYFDSTEPL